MNRADRLRIDPRIVHQTIDGEAVIINLESGCYYSLTGSAAAIWSLLEQSLAIDELAEALRAHYDAEAGVIEESLATFLAALRDEGLITIAEPTASTAVQRGDFTTTQTLLPYHPPLLQKYSDMQDLLLIDPIHEVAESGWPVKPADEQPPS